jgi:integrase
MEDGAVRAKGGKRYKVSSIESYRASLDRHVLPDFGGARLGDVTAVDVQGLVDRLVASGVTGQTVRNVVSALSVVYRFARRRGWVVVSPCQGLELPAGARRRERIVDPGEARILLNALPLDLRALYGVAVYAGLRRGEIGGLDWAYVDFAAGTITVERAYCWRAREFVPPKTDAAVRVVPMVGPLAGILLDYRIESGGKGLVFPSASDPARPFDPRAVARRADTAWKRKAEQKALEAGEDPKEVTWDRIILHEGRHSAASAFIASGLDAVRVARWMGHSQTSTTLDYYAKAFESRAHEDAQRVDAFFAEWQAEPVAADAP